MSGRCASRRSMQIRAMGVPSSAGTSIGVPAGWDRRCGGAVDVDVAAVGGGVEGEVEPVVAHRAGEFGAQGRGGGQALGASGDSTASARCTRRTPTAINSDSGTVGLR